MQKSPTLEDRIEKLEDDFSASSRFERIVKGLSILGAIGAFGWGLFQHQDTRRNEFRKAFWDKQYSLYARATTAASNIAIASDLSKADTDRHAFWSLYWGELSIVESKSVHDAMVAFGTNLSELEQSPNANSRLRQLSYFLARACRESLKQTWEPVPLDDIPLKTAWEKEPNSKD